MMTYLVSMDDGTRFPIWQSLLNGLHGIKPGGVPRDGESMADRVCNEPLQRHARHELAV